MKSRFLLTTLFVLGLPANGLACGAYPAGTNTNDLVLGMVANGSNIVSYTSITNAGSSRQGMLVYNRTNNTLHLCNGGSWITLSAAAGISAAGSTGQVQFNNAGVLGADSGLFWDNTNKRLGIGTAVPTTGLHIASNTFVHVLLEGYTASGSIVGQRALGTPASPTAVTANTELLGISGRGYDGTSYPGSSRAMINIFAEENWTPTAQGAYISASTTAPGGTSRTEKIRITGAGNVGIGTTNPGQRLEVGDGTAFTVARVKGDTTTYGAGLQVWNDNTTAGAASFLDFLIGTSSSARASIQGMSISDGSADLIFQASNTAGTRSDMLTVDGSTGNVGIGTTSPGTQLEAGPSNIVVRPTTSIGTINSNAAAPNGAGTHDTLVISNGGTNPGTSIYGSSIAFKAATFGVPTSYSTGRILSYFDTSGGSNPGYSGAILALQYPTADNVFATGLALRNGNVGIGTTGPTSKLHVREAAASPFYAGHIAEIYGNQQASYSVLHVDSGHSAVADRNLLSVSRGGAAQFIVRMDGNVGIGTTPTFRLDVSGGSPRFRNSGGDVLAIVDSNTSANAGVDMLEAGTRRWVAYNQGSNDAYYIINGSNVGVMLTSGATSWAAASDARLKKNITTFSVLDRLAKYRAVSFDWRNNNKHDIGVIAQELYEIFPELVNKGSDAGHVAGITDTGTWTVSYDRMGALALQAVKELKTANDDLKAAIDEQAKSLRNQEAELRALREAFEDYKARNP